MSLSLLKKMGMAALFQNQHRPVKNGHTASEIDPCVSVFLMRQPTKDITRFVKALFFILFAINFAGAPAHSSMRVKVWNLNFCNHCPDWPERTENMARRVGEVDNQHFRTSDLFAFCEVRNKKEGFPQQRQEPKKIFCIDRKRFAPECFGIHWRRKLLPPASPPLYWKQYGELGFLGNGNRFELEGAYIEREILDRGFLGLGPPILLLGARMRMIGTNYIIPFYITHLRGNKKSACNNIISAVLSHWREGDLPPIVVGDFNFSTDPNSTGYHREATRVMNRYFVEMGAAHGHPAIEHIWVGRAEAFSNPGASWSIIPDSYNHGPEFADPCCQPGASCECRFTDHNVPSVELSFLTPVDLTTALSPLFAVKSGDRIGPAEIISALSPLFSSP